MNERERFDATMHYRPRDRAPIMDFSFWDETLIQWHKQGLPTSVDRTNSDDFFAMDGLERYNITSISVAGFKKVDIGQLVKPGVHIGLFPLFDEKVIEDRGDHAVLQQSDGVRVLRKKFMSSIPIHERHLLTDRASWQQHYKPRLDPSNPQRYPSSWEHFRQIVTDPHREYPLFLPGGSL